MRRAVLTAAFCLVSASAFSQTSPAPTAGASMSHGEIRELLDAAKATAKATRETVDYIRVVPDALFQILAKLDKLENKLDKIENELKATKTAVEKKR